MWLKSSSKEVPLLSLGYCVGMTILNFRVDLSEAARPRRMAAVVAEVGGLVAAALGYHPNICRRGRGGGQ